MPKPIVGQRYFNRDYKDILYTVEEVLSIKINDKWIPNGLVVLRTTTGEGPFNRFSRLTSDFLDDFEMVL